jgi:hypothetical protein
LLSCLSQLLEAGANVDVMLGELREECLDSQLGWHIPGVPEWFTDALWYEKEKTPELYNLTASYSVRIKREITLPEIFTAAQSDTETLRRYLDSRLIPRGCSRQTILDIALSEATSMGDLKSLISLVELGANPDIGERSHCACGHKNSVSADFVKARWNPMIRAASLHNIDALRYLFEHGANVNSKLILYFIPNPSS